MSGTVLQSDALVSLFARRFEYPAVAASCGRARGDVAQELIEAGADADAVEVAELAVSELFTNGLTHHQVNAGEAIRLVVRTARGSQGVWVVLTVVDGGRGFLGRDETDSADTDEHGRGLLLIRGLGVRVGGRRVPGGYLVRARFPVDAGLRTRVCGCDCAAYGHRGRGVCLVLRPAVEDAGGVAAEPDFTPAAACPPCGAARRAVERVLQDADDRGAESAGADLRRRVRWGAGR